MSTFAGKCTVIGGNVYILLLLRVTFTGERGFLTMKRSVGTS
jgi:hypothetical protein